MTLTFRKHTSYITFRTQNNFTLQFYDLVKLYLHFQQMLFSRSY